jgi:hypothetical protein
LNLQNGTLTEKRFFMKKAAFAILALILVLTVFGFYFVRINSVSDGSDFTPEAGVIDSLKKLEITEEDCSTDLSPYGLRILLRQDKLRERWVGLHA